MLLRFVSGKLDSFIEQNLALRTARLKAASASILPKTFLSGRTNAFPCLSGEWGGYTGGRVHTVLFLHLFASDADAHVSCLEGHGIVGTVPSPARQTDSVSAVREPAESGWGSRLRRKSIPCTFWYEKVRNVVRLSAKHTYPRFSQVCDERYKWHRNAHVVGLVEHPSLAARMVALLPSISSPARLLTCRLCSRGP
jgi:hypothetical protein